MQVVVELSLEHPTLPAAEAAAVVDVVAGRVVAQEEGVLLATVPDAQAARVLAERLGLAHAVDSFWYSTAATPRTILPPLTQFDLEGQSFAVRVRRIAGRHPEFPTADTARAAGALLATTGRVDLRNPALEIRVLLSETAHVGALVHEIDRAEFEKRSSHNRPYFSPVSLHPRQARAMANLARIREGDRVLDPFCGTGGLALEAGLLGAKVWASDFDPRMVAGTRDTCVAFGITDAVVEERDVGEAAEFAGESAVDAVVTDPPWGRNAPTAKEALEKLYARFFAATHACLKPGGRLVASFPGPSYLALGEKAFDLEERFEIRVHRSLTRHLAVYRKRVQ